jgi:tropomyosin-1
MDAIKKKMQAMKMEKDSAMDKADTCEAQAKDANLKADKVRGQSRQFRLSGNFDTFLGILH